LKKVAVGLSMGLCGTELAKMVSDIVILDDNFRSIMSALKWRRWVYDNVRSLLQFQVTVNFATMLIAFIGSIALKESPFKALQLLWVNLIMDSLGALALGKPQAHCSEGRRTESPTDCSRT
jgi:Ca2+-transporting ATPase